MALLINEFRTLARNSFHLSPPPSFCHFQTAPIIRTKIIIALKREKREYNSYFAQEKKLLSICFFVFCKLGINFFFPFNVSSAAVWGQPVSLEMSKKTYRMYYISPQRLKSK